MSRPRGRDTALEVSAVGGNGAVALAPRSIGLPDIARGQAPVSALFEGRTPAEAIRLVADAREILLEVLREEPDNYAALVAYGEINLRIGLTRQAQELLYRASLQRPPSWEAYQRTNLLLRRAEALAQHAFDRSSGAPPPFLGPVRSWT